MLGEGYKLAKDGRRCSKGELHGWLPEIFSCYIPIDTDTLIDGYYIRI